MVQTIFNFSAIIYLILSTTHLISQIVELPEELQEAKTHIVTALLINLILLSLGIFAIFSK